MRKSYSPVGVDIGLRSVKLLQLRRHHHGWQVAASAVFRRSGEAELNQELVAEVAQVLRRRGFVGRRVVLATPRQYVKAGLVELPAGQRASVIAQHGRSELARIHQIPPDSFEMAYWPVPAANTPGKTTTVMTNACLHQDADRLVDLFEYDDLDVVALDVSACALARACAARLGTGSGTTLIADLGWGCSQIVALQGRTIVYERTIAECGIAGVHGRIAALLDGDPEAADHILRRVGVSPPAADGPVGSDILRPLISFANDIAQEISSCASYIQRQYQGDEETRLLLTGGGADVPGIVERLEADVAMSVSQVSPAVLINCAQPMVESCSSPVLTGALGLARHGHDD